MKKILGKQYDKNEFFWALMYGRKQVCRIYPRHSEARMAMVTNNVQWKKNGWKEIWSVKRFRYYFKGNEIDAYEHEFKRKEKPK